MAGQVRWSTMLWVVIISKSAALYPKLVLSFPMLLKIFLPKAICFSATKPKNNSEKTKMGQNLKELPEAARTSAAIGCVLYIATWIITIRTKTKNKLRSESRMTIFAL